MSSLKRNIQSLDENEEEESNTNKKLKSLQETNLEPIVTKYFSIIYKNKKYRIPCLYLCTKSVYFRQLLMTEDYQLRLEKEYKEITLPDNLCEGVSSEALEYLLNYITINGDIDQTNIQVIFDACLLCGYFDINYNIKNRFELEFKRLHKDNINEIKLLTWKCFSLSKQYNLSLVSEILADYIVNTNLGDRILKDDFKNSKTLSAKDWRQLFIKLANKYQPFQNQL